MDVADQVKDPAPCNRTFRLRCSRVRGERRLERERLQGSAGHRIIRLLRRHLPSVDQSSAGVVPSRVIVQAIARDVREDASNREGVAEFKVPCKIVFLDEIPQGPTGKLQRIGLAEQLGRRV